MLFCVFLNPVFYIGFIITGTPKTEYFSRITELGPLSCHPTNQQTELPRGNHRVKALPYSDLDATFRTCSRQAVPKQSLETSEASTDRGASRRQPTGQTGAWRNQKSRQHLRISQWFSSLLCGVRRCSCCCNGAGVSTTWRGECGGAWVTRKLKLTKIFFKTFFFQMNASWRRELWEK